VKEEEGENEEKQRIQIPNLYESNLTITNFAPFEKIYKT